MTKTLSGFVLDIETNSTASKIWMACVMPLDGKPVVCTTPEELRHTLDMQTGTMIGHNLLKFDIPKLVELWDVEWHGDVFDTYVASRLYNPNLDGGHSLAAWGKRLGEHKGDFTDYDNFCQEMIDYCIQDCKVNALVARRLITLLQPWSEESIQLEHDVQRITYQQELNGFKLDTLEAAWWQSSMSTRNEEIERELQEEFPPLVTQRWSEKTGKRLKDSVEVFNIGSRQQIAKRLESIGATFKKKTEKGNTVVNEDTLKLLGMPEADMCAEYLTNVKLLGMVTSWLDAEVDGRVHGRVNTIGAVTRRMTHSGPNLGQIPSLPVARQCWTVEDGNVLVGTDAQALELRVLAHYMNDPAYTEQVLHGDIHTYNQELAGLETRFLAKVFIYALLYGAGDAKLGEIVGGTKRDGKELRRRFMAKLPAYAKLLEKVQRMASQGTLPTIDGGRVHVRHEHAALNTLFQSCGAVVMKYAVRNLTTSLDRNRIPYWLVAQVHDEYQTETLPQFGEAVGITGVQSIVLAGEQLGMRCPMDGEYLIGTNWSMTH